MVTKRKKKDSELGGGGEAPPNPEAVERKRLKTLAFSGKILSQNPARPSAPLAPSKAVARHHGRDIVKKSHRKNRFLFSFPGLLAPISGGKIGELKDLGTKNPILYLDFPQGRMKLFGTIVYPKNRYLTLQFPRGGKSVMCEDYFDNMIVFSDAWWIGTQAGNPEESRLDFPKELSDGKQTEYDFKGGAGGAGCTNKHSGHKTEVTNIAERTPSPVQLEDDSSDGENKDLVTATPVRQSARNAGKKLKYAEATPEDDSISSDADEYEDKKVEALDSSSRNHTSKENVSSVVFDIDNEEAEEGTQSPIQNQGSAPSGTHAKKQSSTSIKINKSKEDLSSNRGSLVQATISTLFKKVEEKVTLKRLISVNQKREKIPRNPRKIASPKDSDQKEQKIDSKRKISQDEVPKKKAKVTNDKIAGGKGKAKKLVYESAEEDIEEFSSASQDDDGSDEDWAA